MVDLLAYMVTSSSVQLTHVAVFLFTADVSHKLSTFLMFETGSITSVNAVILILVHADKELGAACATRALLLDLLPVAHPGVVFAAVAVV
jgi:hypothetical protein